MGYFNYGLHGYDITDSSYEAIYQEMLQLFLKKSKVVIGLTTTVANGDRVNEEGECWNPIIEGRNKIALKLAKKFRLLVDDLYSIRVALGAEGKLDDGVHFNENGNKVIGKSKADVIKALLK